MEHSAKRRKLSSSPHTQSTKDADLGDSSQATKSAKEEGESSPARCPICLAPPENRAKSESCSHYFCFSCLKEWSKVKAECPLCKMPIRNIFYNIRSDSEYDEYHVKSPRAEANLSRFSHPGMMGTNSFEHWWDFRIREYRDQLRRRRENELAAREASSNIGAIRSRRMHYWSKTWVRHVDTGNRVRDVSAEFFRENPSQMHRLEPWLKRELTVLYGAHNRSLISCVRDKIMTAVTGVGITSQSFVNLIQPYLLEHTNQFVHEFVSFAKSPYDIYQYDSHAQYIPAHESSGPQQRTSRRNRDSTSNRSLHHRPHRSRWDDSPDTTENSNESSSQSVMLSQTTWGDDAASIYPIVPVARIETSSSGGHQPGFPGSSMTIGASTSREFSPSQHESFISILGIPNPSYHYSGLYPSRRYAIASVNDSARDVEAPLVHQAIGIHRLGGRGGSSARQHGRMEIMRQHFHQYTRRRHAEARKRRAPRDPAPSMVTQSSPHEVIVISSDSDDKKRSQTVLHYKPNTEEQQHVERTKIKTERLAECSSDNSSSSDSSMTAGDSDIEFVKYIKPPHLRTPDVFIELSSTDDDAPGPSTRRDDVSKATSRRAGRLGRSYSTSSSDSNSSPDMHRRYQHRRYQHRRESGSASLDRIRPGDVLQRTKEFLRNAREASSKPYEPPSDNDGEIDVVAMPEGEFTNAPATAPHTDLQPKSSQQDGDPIHVSSEMTSPMFVVTSNDGTTSSTVTSQSSLVSGSLLSQQDKNPKKVFERGKVSVNFAKSKKNRYYDSDSDSDIDVGVEKIMPASPHLWAPVIQEKLPRRGPVIQEMFPRRETHIPDIFSAGYDVTAPFIQEKLTRRGPVIQEMSSPRRETHIPDIFSAGDDVTAPFIQEKLTRRGPVIQEMSLSPCRETHIPDIFSAGDDVAAIVQGGKRQNMDGNDSRTLKSRSSSSENPSGGSKRHRKKSSHGSRHKRHKKHKRADRHHSQRRASKESSIDKSKRRYCEDPESSRCYNSDFGETNDGSYRKSKKSRKKKSSKHRKRSRSSSVEFVSRIRME